MYFSRIQPRRSWSVFSVLFLVTVFPALTALSVLHMQSAGLVVDGLFNDWSGQLNISDPAGDSATPNTDILTLYWGSNLSTDPSDQNLYWMIDRQLTASGNPRVYYYVFLDINQNGSSSDEVDRKIQVFYDPQRTTSVVTVTVMEGDGTFISEKSGNWGDSIDQGGARCEWSVSLADLGIDAYHPFEMRAGAGSNINDTSLDLTPNEGLTPIPWTPIPILGWFWLVVLMIGFIAFTWYRYGRKVWQPV